MGRKKLKIKKKNLILTVVAVVVLVLGGVLIYSYNNQGNSDTTKPNVIKRAIEKITEKEKTVKVIDVNSNTRPFAVMINNVDAVWGYQSGLNEAYLVYEMLAEGGIPREMAVFQTRNVPKIQSIRSSRHYYLDYALENDAIYVHWGWSPQAESEIRYTGVDGVGIDNVNGLVDTCFYRDSTVNAAYEHTGFSTGEAIQSCIDAYGYRNTTDKSPLLKYSAESIELTDATDAKNISITFSDYYTAKFKYNEETKLYEKTQNYTDMYDYASGKRLVTKNIIVYSIGYAGIPGDDKGRLTVDNLGSGNGYLITEGKSIPITWEKSSRSSRTIYKDNNGEELVVNDGRTFIELMPTYGNLVIE